ncbi:MAG: MotA/TolQ/ExbB proton channel family protein [Planctomycetota bacterium]
MIRDQKGVRPLKGSVPFGPNELASSRHCPLGLAPFILSAQVSPSTPDASSPASWLTIVTSGGVPGLLILLVLVGLSMAALYVAVDQALALRLRDFVPGQLAAAVAQSLIGNRPEEAEATLRNQPSTLADMIMAGLRHREFGWAEIEKGVEDALLERAAEQGRRLDALSMIANLAPMVGLLGTVTGMIFAFRQVAVTDGAAGAGELAEGIYQALVTTVGGLCIAIPSLAAHSLLRNRLDGLMVQVTRHCEIALAPLRRRANASSRVVSTQTPGGGRIVAVPPAQMAPSEKRKSER